MANTLTANSAKKKPRLSSKVHYKITPRRRSEIIRGRCKRNNQVSASKYFKKS